MNTANSVSVFHPFRSEKAKSEYYRFYQERAMKWTVPYTENMVSTSFGKTYVRICGPKDGKPLILMHGGSDNSSGWAPNVESFAKEYCVYSVEQINTQNMSICTTPIQNTQDIMNWMNELFDSMGIKEKLSIVSMSYGAYLSARYILSNPNRVDKAVLMAPPNFAIPNSIGLIIGALSMFLPFRYFTSRFFYTMFMDLVKYKGEYGKQITELYIDHALLVRKCFCF